jgi:PAS domain S-box-containing protein
MTWSGEFERRVRLGENRYRMIFDSVYDGILVIVAETYEFADANQRMCEMFGYSHAEMLELNIDSLSSGTPPAVLADRETLAAQTTFGETVVVTWPCHAKDGRSFFTEVAACRADFDGRASRTATASSMQ